MKRKDYYPSYIPRKLLHSLGCDTPEEQDDTEAGDDEEVP